MDRFPIGVAMDGSAAGMAAVRWAASEAARRGGALKVVHVCEIDSGSQWVMPRLTDRLQDSCGVTAEAIECARRTAPGVEVTEWRLAGSVADLLSYASQWSDLLVIGRSAKVTLATQLAGSATHRLATQAHCPVVTVPALTAGDVHGGEPGRIIVGLTDRPTAGRAIDFAIAEAGYHGAELVAVRAWDSSRAAEAGQPDRQDEQLVAARRVLAAHLTAATPDLLSSCVVRAGSPAGVLSGLCRPADLLVLGRHRHSRLLPARLGTVLADCLRQAPCPVAVVPDPAVIAERSGHSHELPAAARRHPS